MGNVPPLDLMVRGTPDQVTAWARECVAKTGGRGLILSAGGGVSPDTPASAIDALVGRLYRERSIHRHNWLRNYALHILANCQLPASGRFNDPLRFQHHRYHSLSLPDARKRSGDRSGGGGRPRKCSSSCWNRAKRRRSISMTTPSKSSTSWKAQGILTIGEPAQHFGVKPGDVVRIPPTPCIRSSATAQQRCAI